MNYAILERLKTSCENMSHRYYKQIYVYEYEKGNNVQVFSEQHRLPLININLSLSEKLKDVSPKRRPLKAVEFINDLLLSFTSDVICIDNFEILFEPSLKINPFELLTNISKSKTLVIAWRGTIKNDTFIYAVPGHPEYKKHSTKDAIIIK